MISRKSSEPISIHADSRAEERHLNLEQLGNVLTNLSEKLQGINNIVQEIFMHIIFNFVS